MSSKEQPISPDWQEFSEQMTLEGVYLDHAAMSPLPNATAEIMMEWMQDVHHHGDLNWSSWYQKLEETRLHAAKLINADQAEIALISNTTYGISLVAEGFPWREGDNVISVEGEFPSNVYPWMNLKSRGVELKIVPTIEGRVDLRKLEAAIDSRTRLLSLSWVEFAAGWRNDLDACAEIAQRKNIYLFVDAIQGLGAFPLDVQQTKIDFLAADGHKWLLGPEAAGVFYLRKEHLDLLRPLFVGWNSVAKPFRYDAIDFHLKDSAARYENGTCNTPGFLGLGKSIELLMSFGIDEISKRILHLTDYACEQLEQHGATIISHREQATSSGIVNFQLPGKNLGEVRNRCRDEKIIFAQRGHGLRISPHAYNNEVELDQMMEVIFH